MESKQERLNSELVDHRKIASQFRKRLAQAEESEHKVSKFDFHLIYT